MLVVVHRVALLVVETATVIAPVLCSTTAVRMFQCRSAVSCLIFGSYLLML